MNDEPSETRELLRLARQGDAEALGRLLERYRSYFGRQAERQLHGRIAARVGASDVVQQTFLEAHRDFAGFRGSAEPELLAWLECILNHNLARVIRDHLGLQKRDARRERSLDQTQGEDSALPQELDAGHSTPRNWNAGCGTGSGAPGPMKVAAPGHHRGRLRPEKIRPDW